MEIARTSKGIVTVKTHNAIMSHRGFPLINPQATAGAIYLVRNPLDIAVSYAELRGQAIDATIEEMAASGFAGWAQGVAYWASGSWTGNVKSWTVPAHAIFLVLRYEDMISKPVETFGSVARHLPPQPDRRAARRRHRDGVIRPAPVSRARARLRRGPETARTFFREGRGGQWRDRLTRDQVSRIVTAHTEMITKFNYLPD